MKNKKLFITIYLMLFIICFTNNCVYASMADYTDEDAEKDTQRMIQEHKENFDSTKSDNNYLKELTINGEQLIPNFERQVIEYSVKIDNSINEIDIIANPEDARAKIKGNGKIDITNLSECKIEVISESGTTRTYFINIIKQNKQNEKETIEENEQKEEIKNKVIEDEIAINEYNTEKKLEEIKKDKMKKQYTMKYIIILIIGCTVIIIGGYIFLRNRKRNK